MKQWMEVSCLALKKFESVSSAGEFKETVVWNWRRILLMDYLVKSRNAAYYAGFKTNIEVKRMGLIEKWSDLSPMKVQFGFLNRCNELWVVGTIVIFYWFGNTRVPPFPNIGMSGKHSKANDGVSAAVKFILGMTTIWITGKHCQDSFFGDCVEK